MGIGTLVIFRDYIYSNLNLIQFGLLKIPSISSQIIPFMLISLNKGEPV